MATTSCFFWIKFFACWIVVGAVSSSLSLLTNNIPLSVIIGLILGVPILFIDYIYRYITNSKAPKFDSSRYIICPRCNIQVDRTLGICPQCKNNL